MKQKLFSIFFALAVLQAVSIQKAGIENGC